MYNRALACPVGLCHELLDIEKKSKPAEILAVPKLESNPIKYTSSQINLFSKSRISVAGDSNDRLQEFNLNQLVLVGILNRNNVNYAFVKVSNRTLMLKAGDKLQAAKVANITNDTVELEDLQNQDNTLYRRRVYLKFADSSYNK